jgi:mono/diheme cytochrome c family protein
MLAPRVALLAWRDCSGGLPNFDCINSRPVRRSFALSLVLLAALALLASGCSTSKPGSAVTTPTPTKIVGKAPTPTVAAPIPPIYQNGDPVAGKAVFLSAGCVGCHTLQDAGSKGTVGPNLDGAQPDLGRVIDRVTKGRGAMPPFKGSLTPKQIAAVAAYVVKATHQ